MIPDLNEQGYLPAGIHRATMDELLARFGHGSPQRQAQADSLRWLAPLCKRAGIERLLINGSFVTSQEEPNDVDCVLLQGPAYNPMTLAAAEIRRGLPFLEIRIVNEDDFRFYADVFFASDRKMNPKGVIEVIL